MLANGTPLSAIGRNIQTVVRATAPWLMPKEPSPRFLTAARFELRTLEECLAAGDGKNRLFMTPRNTPTQHRSI